MVRVILPVSVSILPILPVSVVVTVPEEALTVPRVEDTQVEPSVE
jgi:hypothetical protein